jgi:hypothetical protein
MERRYNIPKIIGIGFICLFVGTMLLTHQAVGKKIPWLAELTNSIPTKEIVFEVVPKTIIVEVEKKVPVPVTATPTLTPAQMSAGDCVTLQEGKTSVGPSVMLQNTYLAFGREIKESGTENGTVPTLILKYPCGWADVLEYEYKNEGYLTGFKNIATLYPGDTSRESEPQVIKLNDDLSKDTKVIVRVKYRGDTAEKTFYILTEVPYGKDYWLKDSTGSSDGQFSVVKDSGVNAHIESWKSFWEPCPGIPETVGNIDTVCYRSIWLKVVYYPENVTVVSNWPIEPRVEW